MTTSWSSAPTTLVRPPASLATTGTPTSPVATCCSLATRRSLAPHPAVNDAAHRAVMAAWRRRTVQLAVAEERLAASAAHGASQCRHPPAPTPRPEPESGPGWARLRAVLARLSPALDSDVALASTVDWPALDGLAVRWARTGWRQEAALAAEITDVAGSGSAAATAAATLFPAAAVPLAVHVARRGRWHPTALALDGQEYAVGERGWWVGPAAANPNRDRWVAEWLRLRDRLPPDAVLAHYHRKR